MPRATWRGALLAESDDTVVVEGHHYFPPGSLVREHLVDSAHTSVCGWKGTARYFDVVVESERNAAGRVAFWKGVEVR